MIASGCLLASQTCAWLTYGGASPNTWVRPRSWGRRGWAEKWDASSIRVVNATTCDGIQLSCFLYMLNKNLVSAASVRHILTLTCSGEVALNILAVETRPSCRAEFSIFSSEEVSRKKKKKKPNQPVECHHASAPVFGMCMLANTNTYLWRRTSSHGMQGLSRMFSYDLSRTPETCVFLNIDWNKAPDDKSYSRLNREYIHLTERKKQWNWKRCTLFQHFLSSKLML